MLWETKAGGPYPNWTRERDAANNSAAIWPTPADVEYSRVFHLKYSVERNGFCLRFSELPEGHLGANGWWRVSICYYADLELGLSFHPDGNATGPARRIGCLVCDQARTDDSQRTPLELAQFCLPDLEKQRGILQFRESFFSLNETPSKDILFRLQDTNASFFTCDEEFDAEQVQLGVRIIKLRPPLNYSAVQQAIQRQREIQPVFDQFPTQLY